MFKTPRFPRKFTFPRKPLRGAQKNSTRPFRKRGRTPITHHASHHDTQPPCTPSTTKKGSPKMHISYQALCNILHLDSSVRHKLLKTFAAKTEQEQLLIIDVKQRALKSLLSCQSPDVVSSVKTWCKRDSKQFELCLLCLAIQVHLSNQNKSQFITKNRKARMDVASLREPTLKQMLKSMIPLIDDYRSEGLTWSEIAHELTTKQRKLLRNRKVRVDYLKKTYCELNKKSQA